MQREINELRRELASLQDELELSKQEFDTKESVNSALLERQKVKWEKKHSALVTEIRSCASHYEHEKKLWQSQMQALANTLLLVKEQARSEEDHERRFLQQLDAELVAIVGRAQVRAREESFSYEGDTPHDSMNDELQTDEGSAQLISNIAQAREVIQVLLERSSRPLNVPALPSLTVQSIELPEVSKSLSERDSSLYSKVVWNDDAMNSMTMSEREAVVYTLINGGRPDAKRDVQIEDLLNVSPIEERKSVLFNSAKFDDLSSIVEEDSAADSAVDPIGLTFTIPDIKDVLASSRTSLNRAGKMQFSPLSTLKSNDPAERSYVYSEMISQLGDSQDLKSWRLQDDTLSGADSGRPRLQAYEASDTHLEALKKDCKAVLQKTE